MLARPTGFIIWLTGMLGAGKSALANNLVRRFPAGGRRVELLDGDDPGEVLTGGLGVTKEERDAVVRRLGYVAKLLARNDTVAVVASLSPYREARDAVRRDVRRFVEIFVDCPMEKLQERDGESIYKRALAGEIKNVPGIDDPYEPPTHAEVVVHSHEERIEVAAVRVLQALVDLKYIGPSEFQKMTGGQRARRANGAARAVRRGGKRQVSSGAAAQKLRKTAARTAKAPSGSRR